MISYTNEANEKQNALETAIDILAGLISRDMSDEGTETLLNAIHYLRAGSFRFNRKQGNSIKHRD